MPQLSPIPGTQKGFLADRRLTRIFLPLAALLSLILCVGYTLYVLSLMQGDTNASLQATVSRMASYVDLQIQRGQESLLVAADTCNALHSDQDRLEYLSTLNKKSTSVHVALFSQDGTVRFSDGTQLSLPGNPFLQETLAGDDTRTAVSTAFSTDGSPALLYAAPLETQGTGILWMDTFTNLSRWLPVSDTLKACVVDRSGTILLTAQGSGKSLDNLLNVLERNSTPTLGSSLRQMRTQLAAGGKGVYYCIVSGENMALAYTPLAHTDWSLALCLPTASLNSTISLTLILGLCLAFLVFLAFSLLILLLRRAQGQHMDTLRTLAFVDPLTGGDNATNFSLKAQACLADTAWDWALVSLDIRSFSLVNRSFGISSGDDVLCHLHRCISKMLRKGELCARIYVDRFDLLLRMERPEELRQRMLTLAQRFNEFNSALTNPYYLPLSVGICPVEEKDCPLSDLQDRANLARKAAKRGSSDQLCTCRFYSQEDHKRLQMEQSIYNRMERALARGDFRIYLQPKVSPVDGKVEGSEALVRWYDPEEGFIQPDTFIPSFERNGFIVQLDQYMFEQSCRCLRRWLDAGFDPPPISVNLSQANLRRPHFLQRYKDIQTRWRVPPHLLELELTETMISEDLNYSLRLVEEIHALGFRCSLDDFGSGYSSLNVLSRLRVDTIKLDKCFLDGMLTERDRERSEQIVSAILHLARELGIRTVAEGVSCASQVSFLSRQPCDLMQGYHFSPPLPAAEFETRFLSPQ